jgi:hypothetical protein
MFTVDRQTFLVQNQQRQQQPRRSTMMASATHGGGPHSMSNSRNVSISIPGSRYEKENHSEPTPMTLFPPAHSTHKSTTMTQETMKPTTILPPQPTMHHQQRRPTQQIHLTTPQPHQQLRQSKICKPPVTMTEPVLIPKPETITKLLMEQQMLNDRIRSELDMLWEALQTLTDYQYPHAATATNNIDSTKTSPPSLQDAPQQHQSTKPPQTIPTIRNPVVHDPTTFGFHRPQVTPKLTPLRPSISFSRPSLSPFKQNRTLRFRAHAEWFIYNPANTDFDRHAYIHQGVRRRPRLSGPRWRAHMISIIKQERRQQAQQVRSLQPSSTIRQRLPQPHTKQEKAHQ